MKREWVVRGGFILAVIACGVFGSVADESAVLRRVSAVFLIWFIALFVNWLGLGVMATVCGIKRIQSQQVRRKDATVRDAVASGMGHPMFWVAFWVSLVAGVVNTLAPLGLIGSIPVWSVVGVFVGNAILSLPAIPLRVWIWRIRNEKIRADQFS